MDGINAVGSNSVLGDHTCVLVLYFHIEVVRIKGIYCNGNCYVHYGNSMAELPSSECCAFCANICTFD